MVVRVRRCYIGLMAAVEVTDEDVARVQSGLRSGSVLPFNAIYEKYATLVQSEGRPAAHKTGFGRALSRLGWSRRKVRKGKGPRGKQVRTETHCRVVPGLPALHDPEDPINILVQDLGTGFHSREKIYRRYLQLGFKEVLTRQLLMKQLGRRGYPQIVNKGVICRYLHLPEVVRAEMSSETVG